MTRRALPVLVAALLGALTWLAVLPVATATASCASDDPPRSPAAFTGVVLSTRSEGRVATVRTDDGRTVTVFGTPAGFGSAITSVDRRYEVGGRYEFHPENSSSPFQDNSCTATRLLSRGAVAPELVPPEPANRTGSELIGAVAGGVLLVALSAAVLLRWRRRRAAGAGAR